MRLDPNRTGRIAVGQRVADEIGQELGDAGGVTGDGTVQLDVSFNHAVRPGGAQLIGDLFQYLSQVRVDHAVHGNTAAQSAPREIHDVVDEFRHAPGAVLHQRD